MPTRFIAVVFAFAFTPALMAQTPPPSANQAVDQPHILCGTRVFLANPRIDRQFAKPTPPGTFTLRAAPPQMCRESFPTSAVRLKQRLPQFLGPLPPSR